MRRIIWNIYSWPVSLLYAVAYCGEFWSGFKFLPFLDLIFTTPALFALHFHIWDKRVGSSVFWKPYVFVFFVWELTFNILLDPMSKKKEFDPHLFIVMLFLMPVYVGTVRYAYRKWIDKGTPNKGVVQEAAEGAAPHTP